MAQRKSIQGVRQGRDRSRIANLDELRAKLRSFSKKRDWDQFHTPKNLAMALAVEVAELMEHFQWIGATEGSAMSRSTYRAVQMEVADVLIYLVRLADKLDIDLLDVAQRKIGINARKYPIGRSRGSSRKASRIR